MRGRQATAKWSACSFHAGHVLVDSFLMLGHVNHVLPTCWLLLQRHVQRLGGIQLWNKAVLIVSITLCTVSNTVLAPVLPCSINFLVE